MKVEQGQIWEVITDDFLTTPSGNIVNRQVKLGKGEKIQIHSPHAWFILTEDQKTFHVEEEEILKHCRYYGKIWDNVRFAGKAKLKEILCLDLFDIDPAIAVENVYKSKDA